MFAFKKKKPQKLNLVKQKADLAELMARALVQGVAATKNGPPPPLPLPHLREEELRARLRQRDQTIHYLSKEIELLRVGINVITEDLSAKEEQFQKLFSSLRDSATFVQHSASFSNIVLYCAALSNNILLKLLCTTLVLSQAISFKASLEIMFI